MSRLEELIQELCPDGVEYKKIGELAEYEQPSNYIVKSTDYNDNFDTPVLTAGQTFILGYTSETSGVYAATKENPVIIFDDFTGAFKWVDFPFKVKSSAMKMIKAKRSLTSLRYVFHLMGFLNYTSSDHKRLWISVYSELLVPVPPLPVQREIVRILDNFTEVTAQLQEQLTQELTARKKQYEYYRSVILRSSSTATLKTLGEICDFVRGPFGGSLKKENFTKEGYAVYEQQHAIYGDFKFRYFVSKTKYDEMRRFSVKPGDLIMSCSGTMGRIAIIPDDAPNGIINQALLKLTPKAEVSNKYLKYYFEDRIAAQMNFEARGGAIKNVASVAVLKDIKIQMPPLTEQKRIVTILDYFYNLCNDLASGLPAEIEARQKQYEYYRDKLLNFKELTA